jgi:hypothetical protein
VNQNNIRIVVAQEFAILQSESATRPNGSPSRDGKNGKEHIQLICTSGTLILHDRGLSHIRCQGQSKTSSDTLSGAAHPSKVLVKECVLLLPLRQLCRRDFT